MKQKKLTRPVKKSTAKKTGPAQAPRPEPAKTTKETVAEKSVTKEEPVEVAPPKVEEAPQIELVEKVVITKPTLGPGNYDPCAIASFYDIDDYTLDSYEFNSPFVSFDGIGELTMATSIKATNGLFTSFRGATELPKLRSISLTGAPVTLRNRYRTMVLCAFGTGITEIDGIAVTDAERNELDAVRESMDVISGFVRNGGILDSRLEPGYVELIQKKLTPAPQVACEVGPGLERAPFSQFMTEAEVRAFMANQKSEISLSALEEIKLRQKIADIESVVNDVTSQRISPKLKALSEVCSVEEVSKELVEIMRKTLIEVCDEVNSIVASASADNSPFAGAVYEPLRRYTSVLLETIERMVGAVESLDNVMALREKLSIRRIPLLADAVVDHLETLWESIKIGCQTGSDYETFLMNITHGDDMEGRKIPVLERVHPTLMLQKLSAVVEDEGIRKHLETSVSEVIFLDKFLKSMDEIPVYLRMLGKVLRPEYLASIGDICAKALSVQCTVTDPSPVFAEAFQNIGLTLTRVRDFCAYVNEKEPELRRIYGSLPRTAGICSRIDQTFAECLQKLKDFYTETALPKLQEEVQKHCSPESEISIERRGASERAAAVEKFFADLKKWNSESEQTRFFFRSVCVHGQENGTMDIACGLESSRNRLQDLQIQVKHKEEEIEKLKAELQAKGVTC